MMNAQNDPRFGVSISIMEHASTTPRVTSRHLPKYDLETQSCDVVDRRGGHVPLPLSRLIASEIIRTHNHVTL